MVLLASGCGGRDRRYRALEPSDCDGLAGIRLPLAEMGVTELSEPSDCDGLAGIRPRGQRRASQSSQSPRTVTAPLASGLGGRDGCHRALRALRL